jgi:hypothetical protein
MHINDIVETVFEALRAAEALVDCCEGNSLDIPRVREMAATRAAKAKKALRAAHEALCGE